MTHPTRPTADQSSGSRIGSRRCSGKPGCDDIPLIHCNIRRAVGATLIAAGPSAALVGDG
jgi:hypothetical protein